MNGKVNLKLDWCSFKAAKFACENWHYSKCMPSGKTVKIGVWEDEVYIGAIIFGRGANNNAAKHFGVETDECAELCRVALNTHKTTVTRILAIALKMLRNQQRGLKLIFSYADKTNQGHSGVIYRAGNWTYLGERKTNKGAYYIINGKRIHGRSARAKYGSEKNFPSNYQDVGEEVKHLFVYTFHASVVEQIQRLASC